ncbi:MAG TPA: hypothetical protein VMC81_05370 [Rhodocyclaceae bacterium]|nr:hypothetical protein [Rhodocyclaceae bacterium]
MIGVPRRLTFALLALALLAADAAWAEPLGRLFLTPERRAMLERQRQLNIEEVQTIEGATVSLDGVVTRSSGRSTVWINQRPQNENALGTGVSAIVSRKTPGQVTLTPGEEAPASLKVGESINRGTREKADALGGGYVTVKPGH